MFTPFDPALAAHAAFQRVLASDELRPDTGQAAEWEAAFSAGAGEGAAQAYRQLLALGDLHPKARTFQEFLIYSTWQQAAEDPIAEHFEQGLRLCDRFLQHAGPVSEQSVSQVRALRLSFLHALGLKEQDDVGQEYERDAFKGGD
jgi:hypothetical protein